MLIARNLRVLRIISFLLIMTLLCPFANGKIIKVDDDGQADFENIQAGIDAAVDGDTVLVAPGEYVITVPITFRGKAITVKSESGRDETTIQMGTPTDPMRGSVVVFENNETDASILEGFTIAGGRGVFEPSVNASGGGGIFFDASSGTIKDCAIVQSKADAGGGVLAYSGASAILINCEVMQNMAKSGGGVMVYSESSATLNDCIIRGNSGTGTTMWVDGFGGGLHCSFSSLLTLTNCTITENSTGISSGGVFCGSDSSVSMTHCTIIGNTSERYCGVMECAHSSVFLANCLIARNTGAWNGGALGCVWSDSSMTISNCTIWGNSGGHSAGGIGCWHGSSVTVTNSIIWGNTSPVGREIEVRDPGSTLNIAYSSVAHGQNVVSVEGGSFLNWDSGNIDSDPFFADPNNNDFHLKSEAGRWDPNSQSWIQDDVTSPCIDAGDPNSPIGSELFPNGDIINMGAYGGTAEASKSLIGTSTYAFVSEQSTILQTGGFAGVNWTYTLDGQFRLTVDFGTSKAWFSNFETTATDESTPDRKLDPNDVFNLTSLTGIIGRNGSIRFTGQVADGSDVLLDITLSDESVSIKGQTTPPPNSADFFIFDLDAVAQRKYDGGTGEINDPYLIYTAEQLNAVEYDPNDWDKHFKLMADIDLSGYSYEAALIAADVDPCDPGFQGISFTGVLDGNGHKISNLTITSGDYVGLFGQTELGAEIKDLGITDVNITGSDYVGGFVGFSKGNISTSYCTGTISGDQRVGGITGRNWTNNITACYSTATITANSDAGGIAANNYGSITNCYNTGAISSYRDAAGLVGENYGTIDKCYSVGAVNGDSRPGGLVSYNWPDGGIVSGFWDVETSGQSISDGGIGKTTAEMQTALTFLEAGWDFVDEAVNGTEDIWWVLEGQDYPRLWWEIGDDLSP